MLLDFSDSPHLIPKVVERKKIKDPGETHGHWALTMVPHANVDWVNKVRRNISKEVSITLRQEVSSSEPVSRTTDFGGYSLSLTAKLESVEGGDSYPVDLGLRCQLKGLHHGNDQDSAKMKNKRLLLNPGKPKMFGFSFSRFDTDERGSPTDYLVDCWIVTLIRKSTDMEKAWEFNNKPRERVSRGPDKATEHVTGMITLDGQPVGNASVEFTPDSGGKPAVGRSNANGQFELDVTSGEHSIRVVHENPPTTGRRTKNMKAESGKTPTSVNSKSVAGPMSVEPSPKNFSRMVVTNGPVAQNEDTEVWRVSVRLDAPKLVPPAVQWTIVDKDPVPGFRTSVKQMSSYRRECLQQADDEAAKEHIHSIGMTFSWDSVFKEVTGDNVNLLVPGPGAFDIYFCSDAPGGKKWLVTKVRRIRGKCLCWCIPIEAEAGKECQVTLAEDNMFDLQSVYDEAMVEARQTQ